MVSAVSVVSVVALVGKAVFTTKEVFGAVATDVVATGAVDVVARFDPVARGEVSSAGGAVVTAFGAEAVGDTLQNFMGA